MRMLKIAHRGASTKCPENTVLAYAQAVCDGADMVEMDVRCTADGAWVMMHDERVERSTNGSGLVSELLLSQVKQLDAGVRFKACLQGTKVPTLQEAVASVQGKCPMLLDVKSGVKLAPLVEFIEAQRLELHSVFGLRSTSRVLELKRLNPNIRVLGFIPRPHTEGVIDEFVSAGVDIIRFWIDEVHGCLIEKAHALGKPVWVMAGDAHSEELQRLRALGCDGVLLNDPSID